MFLGIDFGKKYIGTAIADKDLKISNPYKVFVDLSLLDLFKEINNIILKKNITKIIVGYPISLSGQETEQTRIINKFIVKLKKQVVIEVHKFDERLTSKIANNSLKNTSSKQKKLLNHSVAAAIMLQNYLDYNK